MQENRRDFSVIKDRILEYLELKGITKYAFYKISGTTNGVLSQRNGISEDNLLRFLSFSDDVNLTWLLRGKGEILKQQLEEKSENSGSHANLAPVAYPIGEETFLGNVADVCVRGLMPSGGDAAEVRSVPLYRLNTSPISGGLFSDGGEQTPLGQVMLPNLPPCDGALYVPDDSMLPALKSGDIVLYKEVVPTIGAIVWGEMYLLSFFTKGEERMEIRCLRRADDHAHVRLESLGLLGFSEDIPLGDIRVLALIKATIRFSILS